MTTATFKIWRGDAKAGEFRDYPVEVSEGMVVLDAILKIQELKKKATTVAVLGNREYNPGWHTALDLPNLLTVSEAITRCALARKESRGGHFRDDYPDKDPAFGKVSVVLRKRPDGAMQVSREPLSEMPAELKQIIEEMK